MVVGDVLTNCGARLEGVVQVIDRYPLLLFVFELHVTNLFTMVLLHVHNSAKLTIMVRYPIYFDAVVHSYFRTISGSQILFWNPLRVLILEEHHEKLVVLLDVSDRSWLPIMVRNPMGDNTITCGQA